MLSLIPPQFIALAAALSYANFGNRRIPSLRCSDAQPGQITHSLG
jgi:hypothetical protein